MALNFSANQYDDAFRPQRIKNWERSKLFQEMPRAQSGSTGIIADNKGHLRPEYRRSKTDPWGTFLGTWDLPKRLPGNKVDVPTARGAEANEKLRRDWEDPKFRLTGQRWGTYNNSFYKEGTRSFAPPLKIRSKPAAATGDTAVADDSSSSPGPRKFSPIDRNGIGLNGTQQTNGNVGFDQSYSQGVERIPLPQLNKPIYASENERGDVTLAAL